MTHEEIKGAFKDFLPEQQPERIPLELYDELAEFVYYLFYPLGDIFIPNAHKKAFGKETTGDIDVVFVPRKRETWVDDILAQLPKETVFGSVERFIVHKTNGPQLMTVMTYKGHQYFIDFLLTKPEDFEWKQMFHGFGTLVPAVVGSFARSLSYKFAMDGFYMRFKDSKGNYHNLKLTSDPETCFIILGLSSDALDGVETYDLYSVDGIVTWVTSSPRFSPEKWLRPPQTDGQTIVTKNRKSHAAIKKKGEVDECYKKIDALAERCHTRDALIDNPDYKIERMVLGDEFIDDLLKQAEVIIQKTRTVLDGSDIMAVLGIPGGPEVEYWKKFLLSHPDFINMTQEELNKTETRVHAVEVLTNAYEAL